MRLSRLLPALAAGMLLVGCEGWFGGGEEVPLPGDRISIMLLNDGIAADPRVANLTVVLPPPVDNADWPTSGGNAMHAMQHLFLGDDVKLAWRADIGAGSGGVSQLLARPVIGDGRVFVADSEGQVTALTSDTGQRLWQVTPEGMNVSDRLRSGGLAYGDGQLYVTTAGGEVMALSAADGSQVWRQQLLSPIRTAPTPMAVGCS